MYFQCLWCCWVPKSCLTLWGPMEKAMAPHSSTLAWKIPWMEESGRLQSMGSLRVGHNWATWLSLFTFMHWRRKWQPTPAFLPGESQGRRSLLGCHLWGRAVRHDWSDLAAAVAAHASQVMLKILQARIQQYVNQELPDVQAGFRKGKGNRDQIANIMERGAWWASPWDRKRSDMTETT